MRCARILALAGIAAAQVSSASTPLISAQSATASEMTVVPLTTEAATVSGASLLATKTVVVSADACISEGETAADFHNATAAAAVSSHSVETSIGPIVPPASNISSAPSEPSSAWTTVPTPSSPTSVWAPLNTGGAVQEQGSVTALLGFCIMGLIML